MTFSIFERLLSFLNRLLKEPPLRILIRSLIRLSPVSIRTKADWDAVARPYYLLGVLAAADQALREGITEISVIEFGVAGGNGLIAIERYAKEVERETGIRIAAYGFDTGRGLPETNGDFRDHPDLWMPGDYPMDEVELRQRLSSRTTLLIGNVAETVHDFVMDTSTPPVGFIAFDLDFYSSTREALKILSLPGKRMLLRVAMYFDDIDGFAHHKFAGERLAIAEFNEINDQVKIDSWHGIRNGGAFPEEGWLQRMYVVHNVEAISKVRPSRQCPKYANLC